MFKKIKTSKKSLWKNLGLPVDFKNKMKKIFLDRRPTFAKNLKEIQEFKKEILLQPLGWKSL